MDDQFQLSRFVEAQNPVFDTVISELRQGRKDTHWMWFIFPQVKGLGSSPTANRFAISCFDEAKAYLENPTLGPRLVDCVSIVNSLQEQSAESIFGWTDALKFRSSMTLFAEVSPDPEIFLEALEKYYEGNPDENTHRFLGPRASRQGKVSRSTP